MTQTESWPKISLLTPVFNSAKYIEQTFQSVLSQNYPNLEYFVVDGGSTDGTLDIIRKYESQISGWLSEPDNGMYDAINKGFARTSGEIMGWISATDTLQTSGLSVVGTVFSQFPKIEWITGRRTVVSEASDITRTDPLMLWSRYSFLFGGPLRHIQQESTYWRRSLWERAGGRVDAARRWAGDFELWMRFFRHARLYTVDAVIGSFREHSDSASLGDLTKFNALCDEIAQAELRRQFGVLFDAYKRFDSVIRRVPKVRAAWSFSKALGLKGLCSIPQATVHQKKGSWEIRVARGRA